MWGKTPIILSLLCFYCSDKTLEDESDQIHSVAPDCTIPINAAGEDAGVPSPVSGLFIPASCEGSLFGLGVNPNCGVQTVGQLNLDDDEYTLEYSCYTLMELYDIETGVFYNGFFLTLVTEDGCDPMVGIFVSDEERYGEPPYTIDLDERLCENGDRRAATIMVRNKGNCYISIAPVNGFLTVHQNDTGIIDGEFEMAATNDDVESVNISATFEMRHKITSHYDVTMDFDNLCSQ